MLFHFLLGVKMAPRETESNAYAKFWVTNKEHYGMLWYFLEWSIASSLLDLISKQAGLNAAVTLAVIFQKLELVKSHIEAQLHNHTIRCGG